MATEAALGLEEAMIALIYSVDGEGVDDSVDDVNVSDKASSSVSVSASSSAPSTAEPSRKFWWEPSARSNAPFKLREILRLRSMGARPSNRMPWEVAVCCWVVG